MTSRSTPVCVTTLVDRDPSTRPPAASLRADSELALIERLRGGDAAAFDLVYAEYHARLFNFLARLSRRREVAEDLVEETWLRCSAAPDRS